MASEEVQIFALLEKGTHFLWLFRCGISLRNRATSAVQGQSTEVSEEAIGLDIWQLGFGDVRCSGNRQGRRPLRYVTGFLPLRHLCSLAANQRVGSPCLRGLDVTVRRLDVNR